MGFKTKVILINKKIKVFLLFSLKLFIISIMLFKINNDSFPNTLLCLGDYNLLCQSHLSADLYQGVLNPSPLLDSQ